MTMTTEALVNKLDKVTNWVSSQVTGREEMLRVLKLAIMCGEHVLVIGSPGIAKSMVAEKMFRCFKDADTFTIQCTKRMSEENVLGPLNMPLYKEEGIYRYRTDEGIVPCHFAFLDEFLDAPDVVLRSMLGILNERKYRKGSQQENSNLMTAICTTNFTPDSEALEAVQDRFLFRMKLNPLSGSESLIDMLEKVYDQPVAKRPSMSITEVKSLQRKVKSVEVPKAIYRLLSTFCINARTAGSNALNITDRRVVRAVTAIKASAVLGGRDYARVDDLNVLQYVVQVEGDDGDGQKFADHFSRHVAPSAAYAPSYDTYFRTKTALNELAAGVEEVVESGDKQKAAEMKKVLEAFLQAASRDASVQASLPEEIALLQAEAKSYLTLLDDI